MEEGGAGAAFSPWEKVRMEPPCGATVTPSIAAISAAGLGRLMK